MTTDPANRPQSETAAPPTDSHDQDARTAGAGTVPAPTAIPVSTGPPERPPVYPQHPSSGTWRPVSATGAPLGVREVEAAAPTATAAHTSAQAISRSSVRSPSETAAAGVVLRDLADEYAMLLCAHDPEAAARTGLPAAPFCPTTRPRAWPSVSAPSAPCVTAVAAGRPLDRLRRAPAPPPPGASGDLHPVHLRRGGGRQPRFPLLTVPADRPPAAATPRDPGPRRLRRGGPRRG